MDKPALRQAILHQLNAEIDRQTAAALASREDATNEESRSENKYDMRAQEAAYLAEGQARMAAELREAANYFAAMPLPDFASDEPAAVGAVVTLKGKQSMTCLLAPRAGGREIHLGDLTVLLVTPTSPLGRQLIGRKVGESVNLPGREGGAHVIAALS